jgi:hypothetical protein
VGNDHAAMVRQLWGNLLGLGGELAERSKTIEHMERNYSNLQAALTERNARVHQLEIDNSKVHLEGRIELAEKRIAYFRAWLLGMCPAPARDKFGTVIDQPGEQTDDALIASIQFVPRSDYDTGQAGAHRHRLDLRRHQRPARLNMSRGPGANIGLHGPPPVIGDRP